MATDTGQRAELCPACERFIGPATTCPYCGNDSLRKPAQRFMRIASLVLALLGVAVLYITAVRGDRPVIKVEKITPTMNYAQARIVGDVTSKTYTKFKNDKLSSLSFYVNDGTGSLNVLAYRTVAQELIDMEMKPAKGTRVDVSGRLSVSPDGKVRLNLQAPTQLKLLNSAE